MKADKVVVGERVFTKIAGKWAAVVVAACEAGADGQQVFSVHRLEHTRLFRRNARELQQRPSERTSRARPAQSVAAQVRQLVADATEGELDTLALHGKTDTVRAAALRELAARKVAALPAAGSPAAQGFAAARTEAAVYEQHRVRRADLASSDLRHRGYTRSRWGAGEIWVRELTDANAMVAEVLPSGQVIDAMVSTRDAGLVPALARYGYTLSDGAVYAGEELVAECGTDYSLHIMAGCMYYAQRSAEVSR